MAYWTYVIAALAIVAIWTAFVQLMSVLHRVATALERQPSAR